MNSKKITSSALAALMIAGTTSFTAFAEMPVGTVVIGNQAIPMDWANKDENTLKVIDMMKEAQANGGSIYIKAPNGMWFNNDATTLEDTSVLPEVTYVDAEGTETKYAAGDKDEVVVEEDLKVDSVSAISNTKVEVELEEAVEAVAAESFEIVEKGTSEALNITNATVDGKVVILEVEDMKVGEAYTLTANEVSKNFTAIKEDKTAPKLKTLASSDYGVVTVTFDRMVDEESAENIENYKINNNAEITEAVLNSDRKSVDLTISGLKDRRRYSLTVDDVENVSNVAMKSKTTRAFSVKDFRVEPKVKSVGLRNNRNNNTVIVQFSSQFKLNKEMAEDVSNYSVDGDLEIISAEYVYSSTDKINEVILTTGTQTRAKSYKLTISGIEDTSVVPNVMKKAVTKTFRGGYEDKTGPTVQGGVDVLSSTEIKVQLSDENALDEATALNTDNYKFNNDLEATDVRFFDDEDVYDKGGASQAVIITTTEQEKGKRYKLTVDDIQDEFGAEMKKASILYFQGGEDNTIAPYVKGIKGVSKTRIDITFNEVLDKASATDPTNYVIMDGSDKVTSAVSVAWADADHKAVKLTVPSLDAKKYTVVMSGIADTSGNVLENVKSKVVIPNTSNDTEAPMVEAVEVIAKNQINVHFNENIDIPDNTTIIAKHGSNEVTLEYKLTFDDTSAIFVATSGELNGSEYTLQYPESATLIIKDEAGNKLAFDDFSFNGNTYSNTSPILEEWVQTGPKTIKVMFSEPVVGMNGETKLIDVITSEGGNSYQSAAISDISYPAYASSYDDYRTLIITTSANLKDNKTYRFDVADVKDYADVPVHTSNDGKTSDEYRFELDAYNDDTEAPQVVYVDSTNNKTIEIEYDEDIDFAGVYRLKTEDGKRTLTINSAEADDNIVTLTLSNSTLLKGDENYTLTCITGATDLTGNRLTASDFEQDVMGNAIVVEDHIIGVSQVSYNTFKVELSNGTAVSDNDLVLTTGDTTTTINATQIDDSDSNSTGKFQADYPLLASEEYSYTVNNTGLNNKTWTFNGFVENDLGIELQKGNVIFSGMNGTDYVVEGLRLNSGSLSALTFSYDTDKFKTETALNVDDVIYVFVYNNGKTNCLSGAKLTVAELNEAGTNAAIATAKSAFNTEVAKYTEDDYTPATWTAFNTIVGTQTTKVNAEGATVEEINAAKDAVVEAAKNLVTKADAANEAIAEAAKLVPATLNPVEDTNTNVLVMLNAIDGMSDTGVTLTLDASSHTAVEDNGDITYGAEAKTANVTVKINLTDGDEVTKTVSVVVPKTTK